MDVWPSRIFKYLNLKIATVYEKVVGLLNPSSTFVVTYPNGDTSSKVAEIMNRPTSALIIPVFEYTKACSSFDSCVKEYVYMIRLIVVVNIPYP